MKLRQTNQLQQWEKSSRFLSFTLKTSPLPSGLHAKHVTLVFSTGGGKVHTFCQDNRCSTTWQRINDWQNDCAETLTTEIFKWAQWKLNIKQHSLGQLHNPRDAWFVVSFCSHWQKTQSGSWAMTQWRPLALIPHIPYFVVQNVKWVRRCWFGEGANSTSVSLCNSSPGWSVNSFAYSTQALEQQWIAYFSLYICQGQQVHTRWPKHEANFCLHMFLLNLTKWTRGRHRSATKRCKSRHLLSSLPNPVLPEIHVLTPTRKQIATKWATHVSGSKLRHGNSNFFAPKWTSTIRLRAWGLGTLNASGTTLKTRRSDWSCNVFFPTNPKLTAWSNSSFAHLYQSTGHSRSLHAHNHLITSDLWAIFGD